ncbi:MAG: FtsW/RodA/SpoVE family cell cycle protein [Lachnospiraceae bacterium]
MFAFQRYKFRHLNILLLLGIIFLSAVGIMVIKSATLSTGEASTYLKQIMGVCVSMGVMFFVAIVDYHFIIRMHIPIYLAMVAVLVLTIAGPFKTAAGTGAYRWIRVGPIQLQPSEFAKVAVVVFLAGFFTHFQDRINAFGVIVLSVVFTGVILLLIMKQPDLSTSMVIMVIFVAMIFSAKISYKWVLGVIAVVAPFAAAMIFLVEKDLIPFLENYQRNRILSFLHPQDYPDLARQQLTSVMAIGSGGLYGKGLFNESLDSVKNGNYLSEEDTDFIFAVVGEELGFAGCCLIIGVLLFIVIQCLITAARAKDMEGRLIASGIAAQITFQSFANIGVATFILPNTGLPLPFISAGLSSLLSVFIGAGMVLNISMQRRRDVQQ